MSQTVQFQTIQFNISMQFSSIWLIHTPGQSGPGSNGIPKSSSITGTLPSDCLVSYIRTLVGRGLLLYRDAVGVFYSPSQQGKIILNRSILPIDEILTVVNESKWTWE